MEMLEQATFERIYNVVKQIPYGKVTTYGQVAALAGSKRWARIVGYAMIGLVKQSVSSNQEK